MLLNHHSGAGWETKIHRNIINHQIINQMKSINQLPSRPWAKLLLAVCFASCATQMNAETRLYQGLQHEPETAAALKALQFEKALSKNPTEAAETSFAAFPTQIDSPERLLRDRITQDRNITESAGETAQAAAETPTNFEARIAQDLEITEAAKQTVALLQISASLEDQIAEDRAIIEAVLPEYQPVYSLATDEY